MWASLLLLFFFFLLLFLVKDVVVSIPCCCLALRLLQGPCFAGILGKGLDQSRVAWFCFYCYCFLYLKVHWCHEVIWSNHCLGLWIHSNLGYDLVWSTECWYRMTGHKLWDICCNLTFHTQFSLCEEVWRHPNGQTYAVLMDRLTSYLSILLLPFLWVSSFNCLVTKYVEAATRWLKIDDRDFT